MSLSLLSISSFKLLGDTETLRKKAWGLGIVARTLSFSANICKFLMAFYEDLRVAFLDVTCPLSHRH